MPAAATTLAKPQRCQVPAQSSRPGRPQAGTDAAYVHQRVRSECQTHQEYPAQADCNRRPTRETKPSFKTTELIVYVLSVLGVLSSHQASRSGSSPVAS